MQRLALVFAVALVGCGDTVVVSSSGGGTPEPPGGGGPNPSTGSGTTTTDPPSMRTCGPAQPPCPPTEYCDSRGTCGAGVCTTRPMGCDDDCPGVCGCDGMDYCNLCTAASEGSDARRCEPYAAQAAPGGLDHIVIMHANTDHGTCVRVYVDAPVMGAFDVTAPSPWAVTAISAWISAADCLDWQVAPDEPTYVATAATGSVSWQLGSGMLYPCTLDLDITASYPGPTPWGTNIDVLSAQNVSVEDGCF